MHSVESLNDLGEQHHLAILHFLREEEVKLLIRLVKYHHLTVVHCFIVAKDCAYVASGLGFSQREIERMKLAGLLHDIGKLSMELIVLDEGVDVEEQRNIVKAFGILCDERVNLLEKITMRQLVQYRSGHLRFWDKKYLNPTEAKEILQRLENGKQADVSIMDHIKRHQAYTRQLLQSIGVPEAVIEVAASHHPEYYEKPLTKVEIKIISAVDKFNAMIQSEGHRPYDNPKEISEALKALIDRKENLRVLRILAQKYLPIELQAIRAKSDKLMTKKIVPFNEVGVLRARMACYDYVAKKLGFPPFLRPAKRAAVTTSAAA